MMSTYRLQLDAEFGFHEAAAVVPHLASLGVTHAYLSPILEAAPGSAHGYDVVDHSRLSGERGGVEGWRVLQGALREHGLGCVVDVVPNHMAIPTPESANPAFWAVLRNGRESEYAHWFDVDWAAGDGRLVLPVLGTGVDEAVASGELAREGDRLVYHDHEFPVAPATAGLPTAELVHAQHYTLVCWETSADRLNYRRFFDVSGLIGLRVEDADVFEATHRLLFDLVAAGDVQGLRIDHPDGLADPQQYLARLRAAVPETWVVVEKILGTGETLPPDWPCDGGTGYDSLPAVEAALLDRRGADGLVAAHAALTGVTETYPATVACAKRDVLGEVLAPERRRLTELLVRCLPDADPGRLGDALDALLVAMPVYRTYLVPGRLAGPADTGVLERAGNAAATTAPELASTVALVVDLLLGRTPAAEDGGDSGGGGVDDGGDSGGGVDSGGVAELVVRFQQTSGALAAKGVEDTAFYRWLAVPSLCEVGADPGHLETDPVGAFHRHAAGRALTSMTTLSTHDTKHGEDVRARLRLIAERPDRWAEAVTRWRTLAGRPDGVDGRTDHLLWLTLVSTWPISADRLTAYLTKATREAKLETSWLHPDEAYERAVTAHAEAVLADEAVRDDVGRFVAELHEPWVTDLLAAKLLQLTMPGVPDCYQGAEATKLELVDPDNRAPVDYGMRAAALVAVDRGSAPPDWRADPDAAKIHLVSRVLRTLHRRAGGLGDYRPLTAGGERADHVVAFSRGDAVTVVPRLPVRLRATGGWHATWLALPPGEWTDVLSGRSYEGHARLAGLLGRFPVAFLLRNSAADRQH